MITVEFFEDKSGFEIRGHSGYKQSGSDIICASVSSAAYMTANTISEIIGSEIDAEEKSGYMKILIKDKNDRTDAIVDGLKLHLTELSKQYPKYVIIKKRISK